MTALPTQATVAIVSFETVRFDLEYPDDLSLLEDSCDYVDPSVCIEMGLWAVDQGCGNDAMICADTATTILNSNLWSHSDVPPAFSRNELDCDDLIDSAFDLADISCSLPDIVNTVHTAKWDATNTSHSSGGIASGTVEGSCAQNLAASTFHRAVVAADTPVASDVSPMVWTKGAQVSKLCKAHG
ncbi:hypothetical protein AaE_000152 [Aphanomyces astaci]|uniref:Uncharacterized protein n=1 Tax=Aphanomyces astaci TaxID=112090 RepID=A0A6A5AFE1_APHAT|nr:hypothetical protein AaE_000152 [Aphanomyces astaci]